MSEHSKEMGVGVAWEEVEFFVVVVPFWFGKKHVVAPLIFMQSYMN